MVPNWSDPGKKFYGAFAYHGHDKGRSDSSERVEWFTTRNILTDDPKTAERIMIATALDADRRKRENGVRASGQKQQKPVQTLSLSWHPDEKVSRQEMEQAADEVIRLLGAEDRQIAIFCHNDTAHPHVHLIINRVQDDGRLQSFGNSKRELSRWARDYEKRRGRVDTPKRHEKFRRQEAARQRYTPEQRRAYAERKRAEAAKQATEARNQRVALSARQKDMRERHSAQWEALEARHKAQVAGASQDYKARVTAAMQRHDKGEGLPADTWSGSANRSPSLRPDAPLSNAEHDRQRQERDAAARVENRKREWGEFYRQQRKARQQRADMEKSPVGRLALAITAAREEKAQGSKETLWRLTLVNLISREHREKVFQGVTERDKKALIERQNFSRNQIRDQLRREYVAEIEARRGQQQEERNALKRAQSAERDEIREQWQQLNERRDRLRGFHGQTQEKGRGSMDKELKPGLDSRDLAGDPQGAKRQNAAAARQVEERNDQWRKQREKDVDRNTQANASAENARREQRDRADNQGKQKTHSAHKKELDAQGRHNQSVRKADADRREKFGREAMDARAEKGREGSKERLERLSQAKPTRSMEERRANLERLNQPRERQPRDRSKDQDRDR